MKCQAIQQAVQSPDPKEFLKKWIQKVELLVELRPSKKHMNGYEIEEPRGSPSLEKKFATAI